MKKKNIFIDEWKSNFYKQKLNINDLEKKIKEFSKSRYFNKTTNVSLKTKEDIKQSNEHITTTKKNTNLISSCQKLHHKSEKVSVHTFRKAKAVTTNTKVFNITEYNLQNYQRSNQDTFMVQRPAVFEGQWIQKGDLLADCSASIGGELSLGQNIFVAYMPWEGYNYEDAILISERLVYDDVYTSIHIERYEVEIRETKFGMEEITRQIPEIEKSEIAHLDQRGIIKIGTWVEEGTILVGKVTPTNKKYNSPYQKLLYTILEKEFLPTRDSSLRAPRGLKAKVIDIQVINSEIQKNYYTKSKKQHKVDSISQSQNETPILPLYRSSNQSKIKKKYYKIQSPSYIKWFVFPNTKFKNFKKNKALLDLKLGENHINEEKNRNFFRLNKNLQNNIAISLKHSNKLKLSNTFKSSKKFNIISRPIVNRKSEFPINFHTYEVSPIVKSKQKKIVSNVTRNISNTIQAVHIYLAEKRKIQMGDKMAGRHGNKGIVSQVLPRQDMPYLPDGTPIDMVLNPLGVPSRMNVGQIYECLLGLAGKYLGEYFRIAPFDEIYGAEASRSLVYAKLYEVRNKTGSKWIFNPKNPGKIYLYDGRTGETFQQAITVGQAYMLKLVHLVDDKIHARSTGPYSLVTQQPLRGRSKQGGQRLGEMEVWALEGYGAAFTLLEMLTIKSDDMTGRITLWSNIILNKEIYIGTPESFKVLICELQALCLDIGLFRFDSKGFLKQVEHLMKLP